MATSEKDVLLRISQATSRVLNLDQLLKTSVRIAADALGVDRCSVWLADDKRRYATIKAVYTKKRIRPIRQGATLPINKFPRFKRIISEGKIIHSPDLSKVAANQFEKRFIAETDIKSFLCLPIKIGEKVLGALNFGSIRYVRTFTPSEKRLGQTIANQIAMGIENARLCKELKDRAERLREQSIKVLRESEEKYRTLLENLPQMIFLKDKNSVYISANKKFCTALGIKPNEFKGKTDFDFFPKKLAQKYRKDDREVIKTGKTKEIIEDYIEKGKRRIVQTVKTPVLGDNGKPIGVLGIFWDISEEKEAEQIQSVLYKIADSIHRVRDLKELFQTIHKVLGTVMDTTNFFIALYDKATDTVSLPYCVDQKDKFKTFPAGKTLTAYIIKHGKPLLVTKNVRRRLIESGKVETIGARSKIWLGVPLKVGEEIIGVIAVQSYTNPLAYGKRELEILKYASTQIASAIQQKRAEDLLIRNEKIVRERAQLLTDFRGFDRIDDILKRVCIAVRDSQLFQRAVMTINKPGGDIIHLGQVGLLAAEIQRARKAPPLDPKLRVRITSKRFRISDSFFVPVEADVDFNKTDRYIPQKKKGPADGDWQAGDELFVPLRDFSGKVMGYLSVDTPVDGSRPDRKTIEALEMLVEAAASRIREVEAQKALKQERDFSQSIIETANSLIVCLDHDARIIAFNRECERITGYRCQEVLGKKWPEMFLPPEYRHEKLKSFGNWVRAHPRDQYEGPIKTKNGEIHTILWSNTAILGPGEKDIIAIAIGQDITERKKAEKALRESEETAQAMLNASLDGVLLVNLDGTIVALNEALAKGLGKTREELVGASVFDILPPYIVQHRMKQAMKVVRSKKPIRFVDEREGRIFDQSVYPVLDAQGKVVRVAVYTYDITERKQAEKALQLSQERYELSTKAAKVGVWDWNLKSNKFYIDPNIKEILGYKDKEIPNDIKIWMTYVYPEDQKPVMAAAQACIKGKTPEYMVEHRMLHKDGSVRWILSKGKVIRDKNGKAVRMIGTDTDITERKRVSEALRKSEEKWRSLVENAPNMIIIANRDGKIQFINRTVPPMTLEETIGKNIYDYIEPEHHKVVKDTIKKVFKTGQSSSYLIKGVGPDNSIAWYETQVGPILHNGRVVAVMQITTDVTERKNAEEALRESEKRYRSLFEDSSISLWEEDFSRIKIYVDKLKRKRIKDFRAYLENNPKAVAECASMMNVLDVNQPTLKLFKAKSKEELRRGLRKTFLKESYQAFRDELVAIAKGKTMFETEAVTQTLKGEKKNVLIRWTVAPGCEQTFSKVLVSIIDITERKKAEETVKESQKFLNDIVNHIPDPIFIKNRKHQWILLNKAICEMLGYPREKMLGKSDHDFFPKKQADFFWKKDEEMFRTGKVVDIPEEPITDSQGNIHWLHTKKAPLKDSSGSTNTLVGIIRDITDQKKAVEALRKSKELNTILQISYKIAQIHDLYKMLKLACEETAKALQVERCSISLVDPEKQRGCVNAIYVEDQPQPATLGREFSLVDFPNVLRLYQRGKRFAHCAPDIEKLGLSEKEKEYFRKEGVKSFVVVPIDARKRLLGILLVGSMKKQRIFAESEITFIQTLASHLAVAIQNVKLMDLVKKQAENVEILSQSVISAQEEEKKRTAQQLHDEISQDLALMKINTEITRKSVPAELDQVIQRIKDNENLTIQTLNKVRDLTSYLRPPLLDDLGLIDTLRWYIKDFSKRTNIKVILESEKYRSRLHQELEMVLYRIAQEALANVAKHAQANKVSILLEKKNNLVLLTVKDDGIGFDMKKMQKEQKMKRGFGLFSMEERVKLLNGSFKLTSKLKKGTSLEVSLPCPKGRRYEKN